MAYPQNSDTAGITTRAEALLHRTERVTGAGDITTANVDTAYNNAIAAIQAAHLGKNIFVLQVNESYIRSSAAANNLVYLTVFYFIGTDIDNQPF